jgi:hypothetical protein
MGECIDHPLHQLKANRLLGLDYTGNPAHACPIVFPYEKKMLELLQDCREEARSSPEYPRVYPSHLGCKLLQVTLPQRAAAQHSPSRWAFR